MMVRRVVGWTGASFFLGKGVVCADGFLCRAWLRGRRRMSWLSVSYTTHLPIL